MNLAIVVDQYGLIKVSALAVGNAAEQIEACRLIERLAPVLEGLDRDIRALGGRGPGRSNLPAIEPVRNTDADLG
jgi:hypothetical protein